MLIIEEFNLGKMIFMNKKALTKIIRECIEEVLVDNLSQEEFNNPLYVEYHSKRRDETPFMLHGTKYEFVNAKYPNGKIDIGVYSFGEDLVYSFNAFRKQHNINEMTSTGAVSGFLGKNWVGTGAKGKHLASKSMPGGKLAKT